MKAWFKRFFNKCDEPAYYFAHIPKTAGTSLIVLLDRYFAHQDIMPEQLWRQVSDLAAVKSQDYRFIRGHFGGGGAAMLTHRPLKKLTMLRDPVELSYSTYEFIKRENNTVVHDLVVKGALSFEDFLVHPDTQNLVSNRMVRYLSFDFKQDPSAQEVFLSPQTIEDLQPLLSGNSPFLNDEQRYQRAKTWLDEALWFGVLHRFDDTMRLLSYRMYWPPMGASQKLNKHAKRPVISDLARQRVLENNHYDSQLYDYAQQQFADQYRAMLNTLHLDELSSEKTIDAALDQRYQRYYSRQSKLVEAVEYDCGQKLLGQNWHRREWIEADKAFFRWSGPTTRASLDFWVKPHNYKITLHIINALSESLLDGLKIFINDQAVDWSSNDSGVVRTIQLNCPKALVQDNGLLRIGFKCSQVMSHAEAFGSNDQRQVGFALKKIIIKR